MGASAEISHVFFDFGGTLFSYNDIGGGTFSLLLEAARRLGIEAAPREIGLQYRRASKDAYSAILPRPYFLHRDLFEDTFRRYAQALGGVVTPELLDWFHEAQRELVTTTFQLRDDCLATLKALRERGRVLSIVSNIDDDYLIPMIERAGLGEFLDHWSSSEEARSCKPDPGFYHYACEKAGCTADQVLFVGDSPEQDIAGALGVGMRTALIREAGASPPGHGVGDSAEPHHVIEALGEILSILES